MSKYTKTSQKELEERGNAGLLAAAQAVEHYEISRYGTLKTWAGKLGLKDAIKLLDETLSEEKKTDETLSKDRNFGSQRGSGLAGSRANCPHGFA